MNNLTPGQFIIARRKLGCWIFYSQHIKSIETIVLINTPYNFWVYTGDIGIILENVREDFFTKIVMLIRQQCVIFLLKNDAYNFDWITQITML